MSFSGKVKEELAGNISPARHCRIAEAGCIYWYVRNGCHQQL